MHKMLTVHLSAKFFVNLGGLAIFKKINISIKDKCTISGIKLTNFIQTGSSVVEHSITKNWVSYCGKPSHNVHNYRYGK